MLPEDETLYTLSVLFSIVMALMIVVPYLRRRADLFTFWNLFLCGSLIFIGLSGIAASKGGHRADYTSDEYTLMYMGILLFYGLLALTYYFVKLPRRFAGRAFRTWPRPSFGAYFALAIACLGFSTLAFLQVPIPVIGQLVLQIFIRCGPFAVMFALMAFRKDSYNPLVLLLLGSTIAAALIISLSFGGGRRMAFSLLAAIPIYLYWTWLRYKKPQRVFPVIVLIGVAMFLFNNGLSHVRHRSTTTTGVARAVESLRLMATKSFDFSRSRVEDISQDAVEVTLYTVYHFVGPSAKYEKEWFAAPYFVLVNPIPSSLWEDKPDSFGFTLPMEIGIREGLQGYGKISWGIPPVAQGFHDGGFVVIAIYAIGIGFLLRLFDEFLMRQPDNPFLLGFMAATSAHIVGFSRGSIDVMSIDIIASGLATVMLAVLARVFFGSGYVYPRTDHLLRLPQGVLPWAIRTPSLGR